MSGSVWKVRGSGSIWKVCLEGASGRCVWKVRLEGVWKVRLEGASGKVWTKDLDPRISVADDNFPISSQFSQENFFATCLLLWVGNIFVT